jgi:uncharacterized protein YdbL (DUF1318 family)
VSDEVETVLTDETKAAIRQIAARFNITDDEVIQAVMKEAVRRARPGTVRMLKVAEEDK